MPTAALVLARLPSWQSHEAPANAADIEALTKACLFALPPEYLELLRITNGGEGELAIAPWWFQIWPVQEVSVHNDGYKIAEYHPGFWGFGSSGGGVLLAFSTAGGGSSAVFGVPFDSVDPRDTFVVAKDMRAFLSALGRPSVRVV
jgi:hypothetical protein